MFRRSLIATAITTGIMLVAAPVANAEDRHITLDMSECGLMYLGTSGTCIVSLQTWMEMAVDRKLPVTGEYDSATLVAVQEFQRSYVPEVVPDGRFGDRSRQGLRKWYAERTQTHDGHLCSPRTGFGCDAGAVQPGLNFNGAGKVIKSIACGAVGVGAGAAAGSLSAGTLAAPAGMGAGVFCDLVVD
jgi:peptidoglycan hydrolase-like protein with peptidoglycan-binding domain